MKYSRNHHQYHHYHRVVRRHRNFARFVQPMRHYDDQQPAEFQFQAMQPNFNYLSDDMAEPLNHHKRHVHTSEQHLLRRVRSASIQSNANESSDLDDPKSSDRNGLRQRLRPVRK